MPDRLLTTDLETLILRTEEISVASEQLLAGKTITIRNNRDELCLRYWSLVFEHHQGILLLLHRKFFAPAFALMRPIVEAFLRLHLVMRGTEDEVESIKKGTYRTDFTRIAEQIDQVTGVEPLLGPFFKKHKDTLHGFTHGGLEQLIRRSSGSDIVANYPEDEVRDVIRFTTMFAHLTALHVTDYMDLEDEFNLAVRMYDEYRTANSQA